MKKYTVTVVIHETDAIVTLVDKKQNVIAISDAIAVREVSKHLLSIIEKLCADAHIECSAIGDIKIVTPLSETAITYRAVRTIKSAFLFARDALKS